MKIRKIHKDFSLIVPSKMGMNYVEDPFNMDMYYRVNLGNFIDLCYYHF